MFLDGTKLQDLKVLSCCIVAHLAVLDYALLSVIVLFKRAINWFGVEPASPSWTLHTTTRLMQGSFEASDPHISLLGLFFLLRFGRAQIGQQFDGTDDRLHGWLPESFRPWELSP